MPMNTPEVPYAVAHAHTYATHDLLPSHASMDLRTAVTYA